MSGLKVEIGHWYDPDAPDGIGQEFYSTLVKPLSEAHVDNLHEAADKGGLRLARIREDA